MTNDNRLFDALTGMQRQIKRVATPDEEVLQEFRRVSETLALADGTPTDEERGLAYFVYPKWRTTNLLSWWTHASFENWRDSIGSYNGTLNGSVAFATQDDLTLGKRRRYANFPSGATHYINLGDLTELDGAQQVTWAFRYRPISGNDGVPISRDPAAVGDQQFLAHVINTTDLRFFIQDAGGTYPYGRVNSVFTANTWYSVVVVFDGTLTGDANRLKVYINGVQQTLTFPVGGIPSALETVAANVRIGNSEGTAGWVAEKDIYDVAIWLAALSAAEALAYHNDSDLDRVIAGEFKAA